MFDPEGCGKAALHMVRAVLAEIGLKVNDEQLVLFMNRYDKDKDNYLKYSEFCDAFLPIDSFHASLLAKKSPTVAAHLSALPLC